MESRASGLEAPHHDETVLMAIQPGEKGDPGLVVVRGGCEDMTGQWQCRGHLASKTVNVVSIKGAQSGRSGWRDSGERAEERIGVMDAVPFNEFWIVEVVPGVEPDTGRECGAQLDLVVGGQQRDLYSIDLVAVLADQVEEGASCHRHVRRAPVTAQLRIEHLSQPVQDDGSRRLLEDCCVYLEIVISAARDGGQLPRGHQDHLRAGALDELHLFEVGAGDLVDVGGWSEELISASARGDAGSVLPRYRSASGDQFLSGRPVQPHVPLSGIHGFRDAQPVAEQVTPERQGGVPVNGGRSTRDVFSARIRYDVGGSEGNPASETVWVFRPGPWFPELDLPPAAGRFWQGDGGSRPHHEPNQSIATRRPWAEDSRPASASCSPRTPAASS